MHTIPATPTDINQVIPWIPDKAACLMWAGPQVQFPLESANLLKEINYNPNNSFVLRHNGCIKAFGQLLTRQDNSLHLARIIVDPASRGKKYGHQLCTDLIQIASEKGVQTLTLNVYRNNAIGVRLYRRLGFGEVEHKSNTEHLHMIKNIS